MSSTGGKMGLDLRATKAWQNALFIRGELRYAFGTVDYNGSGNASGEPDWYIEARGLVGKDWAIGDALLSPYTGFGYRYLLNDARGISCVGSTCYFGYRRESNYFYWPIGIVLSGALNDQARWVSTVEYDQLLAGKQISRLSDGGAAAGYSDVTNNQSSGYGLKLSVMYQRNNWAIGPYAHYWNIGESDWVPLYQYGIPKLDANGRPLGGVEPQNNTVEFGFKANQQF
jgi:hypothetical protein